MNVRPHRDRYESPRSADLRVLLAIAETGSQARAATKLELTVPAVHARLRRLYKERGIPKGSSAARAVWLLREELESLAA